MKTIVPERNSLPATNAHTSVIASLWLVSAMVLTACGSDDPVPVDPRDRPSATDTGRETGPSTEGTPADTSALPGTGQDSTGSATAPALPPPGTIRACLANPDCADLFVVAHRGLVGENAPENSIAAIRGAARAGVPMVEVDVRTSADRELVLVHDGTVDRTTDGSGRVEDLTLAELRALLLTGGDPDDPESSRVPTLAEALAVAREEGVAMYLDVKDAPAAFLVAAVREAEMMDQALFRRGVGQLVQIRERAPEAWVLAPVGGADEARLARGRLGGVGVVELTDAAARPSIMAELAYHGFVVQQDVMAGGDLMWRLNGDTSGWDAFLDAGVRLLQSDDPVPLMAHVAARGGAAAPAYSPPCTPACGVRECGDDGCGGSCGSCAGGARCGNGVCGGLVEIDIEGFGAATTGGWQAGHTVVEVTSLADDGPGSLRQAVASGGAPRVVRFAVDGRIALERPIALSSNLTIDGRGRDVVVAGKGFVLHGIENVILTHLAFEDITPDTEDGLQIGNGQPGQAGQPSRRIALDHLRFTQREGLGDSNFVDEAISIIYGSTDVTIAWCRFENIEKGILIGNGDAPAEVDEAIRVTLHHNLFNGVGRRMPRVRHGQADVVNNVFLDWRMFQPVGHDTNWRRSHGPWCHTGCEMILEQNVYSRQPHRWDEAGYIEWPDNASRCAVGPGMEDEWRGAIREVGSHVMPEHAARVQFRVGCVDDDPVFTRPYPLRIQYADDTLFARVMAGAGDGGR